MALERLRLFIGLYGMEQENGEHKNEYRKQFLQVNVVLYNFSSRPWTKG